MGIKYFFSWLKNTFRSNIRTVMLRDRSFCERVKTDTLLIDMNGVYHYCAQKIFQYGNFEGAEKPKPTPANFRRMYRLVGDYLDRLIQFVGPRLRVIMAVDGPAPLAKQAQQRSRRFRSSLLQQDGVFDSNSITPGTEFMDYLTRYIDWWLRKRMSEGAWNGVDVIFSSEKTAGEGEHKLVDWVRRNGTDDEVFMFYGMDADLVMLALATHRPHFHVLRDDPNKEYVYYHIDLEAIREHIANALLSDQPVLDDKVYIIDFVALVAFTGNDFLPNLPTIEILGGGLENLLATYRAVSRQYGSLTTPAYTLQIPALKSFLGTLGTSQTEDLIEKYKTPIDFPDQLLAKFIKRDRVFSLDWEGYRTAYYCEKMGCLTEEDIFIACMKFIDGLQWVLTYYTRGTPYSHWRWLYPYHHAPFLTDLAVHCDRYYEWNDLRPRKSADKAIIKKVMNPYDIRSKDNRPYPPLLQLLSVLPPKGAYLLPSPIAAVMQTLSVYYPEEFRVDMDGKRKEHEGIAVLPVLDYTELEKEYAKVEGMAANETRRNRTIPAHLYRRIATAYPFPSFYGDLECSVSVTAI